LQSFEKFEFADSSLNFGIQRDIAETVGMQNLKILTDCDAYPV